jgi:hypothetical protein
MKNATQEHADGEQTQIDPCSHMPPQQETDIKFHCSRSKSQNTISKE